MPRQFLTLLALLVVPPLLPAADAPKDGEAVYKAAVPSVVWIHSKREKGLATGSGSLIDADRKLVLTNYHVVQDTPTATIFFPEFKNGRPIAEKEHYVDRAKALGVAGRVLAVDKKADLAIIRLASVPEKAQAIPLAAESPGAGANVHSIGNTGKSGALFGYVKGTVRQVYKKEWKAELEPGRVARFEAEVVETDSPTNPGDSGGPLLNSAGELVGVTQGGATNAQLVSTFIDISEVKRLLATRAVRDDKAKEKRKEALKVTDGAKLFSAEAVKEADTAIEKLHAKGIDVLVETLTVGTGDEKKLKELRAAKAADRVAFFKTLTQDRMEKQQVHGFGIVICADPKSLYVDLSEDAAKQFPDEFALKVRDAITEKLKANKPDEALKAAVQMIQEGRAIK